MEKNNLNNLLTDSIESFISIETMKLNISTSLEDHYIERINRLVEKDVTSQAAILRKCVVRYLPELEREILGESFVAPKVNGQAGNGEERAA